MRDGIPHIREIHLEIIGWLCSGWYEAIIIWTMERGNAFDANPFQLISRAWNMFLICNSARTISFVASCNLMIKTYFKYDIIDVYHFLCWNVHQNVTSKVSIALNIDTSKSIQISHKKLEKPEVHPFIPLHCLKRCVEFEANANA